MQLCFCATLLFLRRAHFVMRGSAACCSWWCSDCRSGCLSRCRRCLRRRRATCARVRRLRRLSLVRREASRTSCSARCSLQRARRTGWRCGIWRELKRGLKRGLKHARQLVTQPIREAPSPSQSRSHSAQPRARRPSSVPRSTTSTAAGWHPSAARSSPRSPIAWSARAPHAHWASHPATSSSPIQNPCRTWLGSFRLSCA